MFTTQEQEIIKYGLQNGKSKQEVTDAITSYRTGILPTKPVAPTPTFLQDAGQDLAQIGTDIKESTISRADKTQQALDAGARGEQGALRTTGQIIGQGAGFTSDIIGNVFKGVVKAVLPQEAETGIKTGISNVMTPVMESEIAKSVIAKYNNLDEKTKRDIDATLGVVSLAGDIVGAGVGKRVAQTGVEQSLKVGVKGLETGLKATQQVGKTVSKLGDTGIGQSAKEVAERIPRAFGRAKETLQQTKERAIRIKQSTPEVATAIKSKLDQNVIDVVTGADKVTQKSFKEVVDIASAPKKVGIKTQPTKVGGDLVSKQYDLILKEKNVVGKQLGDITDSLSKTKSIVMTDSFSQIDNVLKGTGIKVKKGKLDFTGSKYTPSERTKISELYKLATEGGDKLSASQIRGKDQLFSKLQREARMEGVGDLFVKTVDGDKSLFSVFRDIYSGKLNTISPEIKSLNQQYSKWAKLTDDIEGSIIKTPNFNATKSIDPAEFAKVNLRRIFGEAQSSPAFEAVADALDKASRGLGYKGATPKEVARFAEEVRKLFPDTIPATGFQGGIATGVKSGLISIIEKGLKAGAPNLADQQKALKALLDSLVKANKK